jgi:hypothetical protein
MSYSLADAIALYQKAQLEGREIFAFPPGVPPGNRIAL